MIFSRAGTTIFAGGYPSSLGEVGSVVRRIRYIVVLAAVLASSANAPARAQGNSVTPRTSDQKACADQAGPSAGENLSEKLDRGNGVICPPNVDPGIKAPTPNVGKMPVIPPPGSPGGDPSVQPK